MYELFIEGLKVDIDQKISVQLSYAIDDVANFSSRETSFSKTIVLPGTGRNNQIFGFIYDLGSFNYEQPGAANIGAFFNVAQTSSAELRLNGLLVLRGIFRLTGIIKEGDLIEYEGALFGELSGLMSQISNKKLEDLDFSAYNHTLTHTVISNSWDNTPGSGYFYPLIDYGLYRENAVISGLNDDYDIGTFRPALYVKEYIDKMFQDAGYTYQSTFFNSNYFKSLIIPHNQARLTKLSTRLLTATASEKTINTNTNQYIYEFDTAIGGNFTINGTNSTFTYNQSSAITVNLTFQLSATYTSTQDFTIQIQLNGGSIQTFNYNTSTLGIIEINQILQLTLNQNDEIRIAILNPLFGNISISQISSSLIIDNLTATTVFVSNGDSVIINDTIPQGIFQKDFLSSLIKMFNLYITEDRVNEKKLIIEPYIDYMSTNQIDWTYKIARDKSWQIKPMGNLNGRIFEYKYKEDNDYYNESYKKKFNQNYADRQYDTGFPFANDKVSTDIIFASSPLIQYESSDKFVVPIYKKSNELAAEDRMDSVIRILFSKKKSADSWNIKVNGSSFAKTSYGYAGHLDDPNTPAFDLNFGAPREVYFTTSSYPSANLFNRYWSEYIAEIADKDSKLLTCHVYLTPLDIAQLDFAKPIIIDGILFRLNKIEDFDYTNNELVKVELLKIINNG